MAPTTRVEMTRPHFDRGRPGPVRLLVIHATAGHFPGDFGWLKNGGGVVNGKQVKVSVQYYIDKQGRVTQFVDDADTAWHCGESSWTVDGKKVRFCNAWAVGIELENTNTGADPYPAAQYTALLELTRHLVAAYQIPRSQLVRHLDISPGRKTDPAGFPWSAFVAEVYGTAQTLPIGRYRVRARLADDPADNYAQVRTARSRTAPEALIGPDSVRLQPGDVVDVDDITDGWAHLASGIGFVALGLLERADLDDGLTFLHRPRISKATFAALLARATSPATAEASAMYDGVAAVGVDPAVFLAFFWHENQFGKKGICADYQLKNPGNVRRAFDKRRGQQLDLIGRGPFFRYDSWTLGAIDWAERMKVRYADPTNSDPTFAESLDTVEEATPVYAPVGDGNDPGAYARAVRRDVERWMQEDRSR